MDGRPSLRFGSGREDLPEVREWSGCPLGGPGVVERSPPEVREWSGGHSESVGVVGRHSRRSGSCQVALLEVWEWSGGPP